MVKEMELGEVRMAETDTAGKLHCSGLGSLP